MEPISGMISDAIHAPSTAPAVREPPQVQQPEDAAQSRRITPARDEYVPEKKFSGDKAEKCTGNTDKVDREIEKLKKTREALERQINLETDDAKIRELERKLAQVESELRQKDNDTYRRQHAAFN